MRWILCVFAAAALLAQPRRDEPRGTAGQFDYYVMSLSWSPGYCGTPAGLRDTFQCAGTRQYNFVLHGLWPQYERGYPQYCENTERISNASIDSLLDIMPSKRLIVNEWRKHGVCSGETAAAYTHALRKAFDSIRIPAQFRSPKNAFTTSPAGIMRAFAEANRGAPADSFAVQCSGRFLSEVRVCLTRSLAPRACTANIQRSACREPELIVQPLR